MQLPKIDFVCSVSSPLPTGADDKETKTISDEKQRSPMMRKEKSISASTQSSVPNGGCSVSSPFPTGTDDKEIERRSPTRYKLHVTRAKHIVHIAFLFLLFLLFPLLESKAKSTKIQSASPMGRSLIPILCGELANLATTSLAAVMNM